MRALLLASALALTPAAGWAQTSPNWVTGYRPPNAEQNSWWADKADFPLSTVANAGLNPLPARAPVYNWGAGIPSTVPGGVADPLGFYPQNGAIIIYKPRSWGTEDRAVALSAILNALPNPDNLADNSHPGVLGSIANVPSRLALANGSDSVAAFFADSSLPPIATDPAGTFDATHYYPSAGHVLTAAQVAQLRVGMYVYVAPAGTYSLAGNAAVWTGMMTGWNPKGTSIQVSGWFKTGNQAARQVPTNGTLTAVGAITGLWAQNSVVILEANTFASEAIGYELDMKNDTGIDPGIGGTQLPFYGFDANSSGKTEGQFAFAASGIPGGGGGWAGAFVAYSGSFCVVCAFVASPIGAAFYSNQTGGLVLSESNNGRGTVSIDASGNAFLAGNLNVARTIVGTTAVTASGAFTSTGTGGEALLVKSGASAVAAIDQSGDARFDGTVDIANTNVTGLLSAGAIHSPVITASSKLEVPQFKAPSGTCTAPGSLAVDTSGTKLYVCPSNGGRWKYVTLSTN